MAQAAPRIISGDITEARSSVGQQTSLNATTGPSITAVPTCRLNGMC